MRVLIFPGFLPDTWSAIEQRYIWLDAPIAQRGRCHWLIPSADTQVQAIYVEKLREVGATLISRKLSRYNIVANLVTLAKVFRDFRIDVVYTHFGALRFQVEAAAKLCGVKVARGEHNFAFHAERRFRPLKRLFWRWTTTFFVPVSQAVATHLRENRVMGSNFRVVHDGFDLALYPEPDPRRSHDLICKELNLDQDTRLLVCIAKIHRAKRQRLLVDMMRVIPDETVVLLLVGGVADEEYAEEVRGGAQSLGLQDRVIMLGYRTDIAKILDAAEISYLPSVVEGLGNVIVESGLMATPAIATDLPAIREIVEDQVDGYLVSSPEPDEYARLTMVLLENELLRNRIGSAARTKMRNLFGRETFVENTLEALEECYRQNELPDEESRDR